MLKTKLCDLLNIKYPIMLAGMGGIANKDLVAAVSNAGGFGTWGSAIDVKNKGPDELLDEIKNIQTMCNGNSFGVDILVHGAEGGVMKKLIEIFAKGGAKVFVSGKGFPRKDVIETFHSYGMLVASIAGKVSHAIKAVKTGVDFVIVQGCEGGGHTGEVALSVLLPQVVDAIRKLKSEKTISDHVCVVAAGGIFDGRGLVSALALGADGIWVGTRFMMTPEAKTHQKYKEKLLNASSDDTIVTTCFTGSTLRVLNNSYVEKFKKDQTLLEDNSAKIAARAWKDGCWKLHGGQAHDYDDEVQAYVCGQNIGAITTLVPAADIVKNMVSDAERIIKSLQNNMSKL